MRHGRAAGARTLGQAQGGAQRDPHAWHARDPARCTVARLPLGTLLRKPCRTVDEGHGHSGHHPRQAAQNDDPRQEGAVPAAQGEPRVSRAGAQHALGQRFHLHRILEGGRLCRLLHRRLRPADHRQQCQTGEISSCAFGEITSGTHRRWNGSTGSTTVAFSSPSAISPQPKQRPTSMRRWKVKSWPRNYPSPASGKPGGGSMIIIRVSRGANPSSATKSSHHIHVNALQARVLARNPLCNKRAGWCLRPVAPVQCSGFRDRWLAAMRSGQVEAIQARMSRICLSES
ncbi:hypothetical protein LA6_000645 [Marinibacterium anthonyi]|nr:hypothetical protein LA6_000645 [Marinibacterium anthonyi]